MFADDGTSLDFDTTPFFTATAAGCRVSLLNAATHEIGHSLGLKPNSKMLATTSPQGRLSPDDTLRSREAWLFKGYLSGSACSFYWCVFQAPP